MAALRKRGRDIPKILADAHAAVLANKPAASLPIPAARVEGKRGPGRPKKVTVGDLLAESASAEG